jgi:gluconate 2-dehydrogenase gamma chain
MATPHESPFSRRQFLGAATGAVAWLAIAPGMLLAAGNDAARDATLSPAPPWRVLTTEQAATMDAFAAQIVPADAGSPGAREAHVTRFLDNALASFAREQRAGVEQAIAALNDEAARHATGGDTFSTLGNAQQVAVMQALEKSSPEAFEALRTPVITGMFANPSYGGNAGKAGWKLIGFEDRFFWQPPFGYYDRVTRAHGD